MLLTDKNITKPYLILLCPIVPMWLGNLEFDA